MTSPVPPFDVALDDHGYMLDLASQQWKRESIPLLRPSFISADRLGENDINPESNWRYSDVDWSHGAGQRRADMPDSDTARFWKSQGVDVWTKWQLSLLPDVAVVPDAPLIRTLFVVQDYLYALTTTGISFTDDLLTWQEITGVFPNTVATDGSSIYYTNAGTLTLYSAAVGDTTGAEYNAAVVPQNLEFVKGRLLNVEDGSDVKNIVGTAGDDVVTVGTLIGATAVGQLTQILAEGPDFIYLLALTDDGAYSKVFKIGIADDGTSLNPPIAASPPIPGAALCMMGWIGFVVIGFDDGFRLCIPQSDGSLTVGALVRTGTSCGAFAGRSDFLYFGWSGYGDAGGGNTYTGLGRLDPKVINEDGAPAYASDLMAAVATAHATTVAAANFNGRLLFVTGDGALYAESTTDLVASGYLDSGLISYDLPDDKAARYLTLQAGNTSAGAITPSLAVNGGTSFTALTALPAGELRERVTIPDTPTGGAFEVRVTLARNVDDSSLSPVLTRVMLESDPLVPSGYFLYVPILLTDPVADQNGTNRTVDVVAERAYLLGLRENGTVVTYQELAYPAVQVTVEDIQWLPTHRTEDSRGAQSTVLLKLKTV